MEKFSQCLSDFLWGEDKGAQVIEGSALGDFSVMNQLMSL